MKYLFSALSSLVLLCACQESFDQRLKREAEEFTRNHCPSEPEVGTRLDSTTYDLTHRTYTFWYSLSETNEQIIRDNAPLLHHRLVEQLKADVNYKSLKDKGVTFRYHYRSQSSGGVLFDTSVTKQEYAAAKQ